MEVTADLRLLKSYLESVTSDGNSEMVAEAWNNLIELEKKFEIDDIIDIARHIIINDIKNINEMPKLLEFFSRTITENPFEVINDPDGNNSYTIFMKRIVTESENLNLLCDVIKVLIDKRSIYLPNKDSVGHFCKAIVQCLSLCAMPDQSDKVAEFKTKTKTIHKYLSTVINLMETKSICMRTLYDMIIITTDRLSLGAALVIILQLIEPTLIPELVQQIIDMSSNDENLSQLVCVLCHWLTQWLNHHILSIWIQKFIEGLHNKCRYSVLNTISNNCLLRMINVLILPMARLHAMPFVRLMLVRMDMPTLFHKIIKPIEKVLTSMGKENSQSTQLCIQDLVNYVTVLMMRFPDYPCNESLQKYLPLKPQTEIVDSLLNLREWNSDNKLVINNYNVGSFNNKQVGLNNLGNTCYMNSVLQALVMTPRFCDQILNYDEDSIGKNCILNELQRLFALLLYSQRPFLSPTAFFRASRPSYFTPGQQHDSAEFLCHLLDALYEQERSMMNKCKNSDMPLNEKVASNATKFNCQTQIVTKKDRNSNDCDVNNCKLQSNSESKMPAISQSNLVYRVFGGESSTTYQCNQCHTSSHNNDHYWELQLSFPEERSGDREITVKDLINYYLMPEKLTGDNMYHCDRCNSLCDAQRIIEILRAPAHLILTLKHFHYDADSRLKTKLSHKVIYDEIIQIPVLNNGDKIVESYELYAAVVHSGYSMDYGHYVTYARDRTRKWYKFNDSCVYETTLNEFFQLHAPCTPYILFYEKITDNTENEIREKPILSTLNKNIRSVITKDLIEHQAEQNCVQNRLPQIANDDCYHLSTSLTRQRDNSDDDNPPPTNCRDSVDIEPNRYLY